ncbi:unnamed protein product [Ixodes hexagonus]
MPVFWWTLKRAIWKKKKIEQVQSRAARFVTGNYNYRESATALKKQLDLEPLSSRRRRLRLKFLHAIYHDQTGINKAKFIQPPNFVSRRLDHSEKIRESTPRTNVLKYSFFPHTIKQWNDLPNDTVSILSNPLFFDRLPRDSWAD